MVAITDLLVSAWLMPLAYGANSSSSAASSQYTIPASVDVGANLIANIDDPEAIEAQSICPGYKASNVHQTSKGFTATLNLAGEPCNVYGMDVDSLDLSVEYQAADRLNIQIVPTHVDASNASWYFLNEDVVPRSKSSSNASAMYSDLAVEWSNDPSFNFKVVRKANGDVLFNTERSVLVYENQFIEFVTSLPENYNLYGLGERLQQLRILHNATLTTYASDAGNPIDSNLYGTHPFYLDTRYFEANKKNGSFAPVKSSKADPLKQYTSFSHGVFLRNAHGQEVITKPQSLTWRGLGGSIDLTFYSGPSQAEVTKNYQTSTVGLPAMQQYNTLGYHQCRWGYTGWADLQNVIADFDKFDIPIEYIWVDIDYMRGYRDFDNEQTHWSYEEGKEFLDKLHQSGRRFVPLVDSALYIPNPDNASDVYETYDRGAADDLFLKNPDGSRYIGSVWPGYTVFPDWHHPKATNFWANELAIWHDKVAYDGVWIDMGECSSFCVGSCGTDNLQHNPAHPPFALPGEPDNIDYSYPEGFSRTNSSEAVSASAAVASQSVSATGSSEQSSSTTSYLRTSPTPGTRNINHPPYVINNVQEGHDLAVHAISPNATHIDGVQEYDVHNLNGHQILNATYHGLLNNVFPDKRPFILGRATFAGSGRYAAHWGGDNVSKWSHMFLSISQALSFSLFGIPMFGTDTCGFSGNADEELCNRWMQLSAFFPFYRNHNVIGSIPQEPYRWSSVISASKKVMTIRYAILPYIYTLFHQAHTTGSTVLRALPWEFPMDATLAPVDTQFLLGPSLMVLPVLEPNASSVKGVFPGLVHGELWYDWYTQTAVNAKPGVNTTIPAPLGHIPLYLRGGSVIPMQEAALTTRAARNTNWGILAALGSNKTATGELYLDDGESLHPNATMDVRFRANHASLSAAVRGLWVEENPLANVTVLGVERGPSEDNGVRFNKRRVSREQVVYNGTSKVLFVGGLQGVTGGGAFERNWVLEWN